MDGLRAKIREAIDLLIAPNRSREKERRQFTTDLSLYVAQNYDGNGIGHVFPWLKVGGKPGVVDRLVDLLTRDLGYCDFQLRVKPSMRSKAPDQSRTHFDLIKHVAGYLVFNRKMPTLSDLFRELGAKDVYLNAMSGWNGTDNLYVQDLMKLLNQELVPTLASWIEFREKWPLKVEISLHEKLYLSRLEIRTFAADKNALRSLVGGILHKLLSPNKGKKQKQPPPYTRTIPPWTKNLLELWFSIHSNQEYTLLLGDISSFTGSFKNMWTLIIELIHCLEERGLDRQVVVDVGGSLIEVGLTETLKLFVYMGSAAGVKDEDDLYFPLGAALGVAGIDTFAKIAFGLILEAICESLPSRIRAIPYAGGDDFAIGLTTRLNKPEDKAFAISYLRSEISRFVGRLKTFDQISLPNHDCDFVPGHRFCKKFLRFRVVKNREGESNIRIQSQWSLPLYKALVSSAIGEETDPNEVWEAISKTVPYVPERRQLIEWIYTQYSMYARGLINPFRKEKFPSNEIPSQGEYSKRMVEMLSKIEPLLDSEENIYRNTLPARLSSIPSDRWKKLFLLEGRNLRTVIVASGEFQLTYDRTMRELPDRLTIPNQDLELAIAELQARLEAFQGTVH
jgi:hypothetical protein